MSYTAAQHVLTIAVEALAFTPIVVLMVDFVLFLGQPRVEPTVSLEGEPGLPSMAELLSFELPSLVQPDNVSYEYTEAVSEAVEHESFDALLAELISSYTKAEIVSMAASAGLVLSPRMNKAAMVAAYMEHSPV